MLGPAEAEAKKSNWNMAIVILDSGGNMVMMHRMDGTQLGSVDVAKDKAWSAVAFRRPTKVFEDGLAQGGAALRILGLRGATPLDGGLPITVDGKVIGIHRGVGCDRSAGCAGGPGGNRRVEVGGPTPHPALSPEGRGWGRGGGGQLTIA